jgi:hypothetical protein
VGIVPLDHAPGVLPSQALRPDPIHETANRISLGQTRSEPRGPHEERVRMLRAGAEMDHDIKDVIEIVSVKTYKKWTREEGAGREVGRVLP